MVEINSENVGNAQALADALVQIKENASDPSALNDYSDHIQDVSKSTEGLVDRLSKASDFLDNFKKSASGLFGLDSDKFFNGLKASLSTLIATTEITEDGIINLVGELSSLFLVSKGKLSISNELLAMGNYASEASTQLSDVYQTVGAMIPGVKTLDESLKKMGINLGSVFAEADNARNLETTFLRQAASSGELNDVLGSLNRGFEDLSAEIIDYSNTIKMAANANNISYDSAVTLTNMLRRIPGAMDTVVNATEDASIKMNMLDATLKVASGTMQSHEEVMRDVRLVYENFGTAGEESLQFVARMSMAAQELKMPMEQMRSYVSSVTDSFKFLGDNTQAAINIMGQMAPALKDSGLGPAGIRDIVSGITRSVAQLDLAQRSFLSAQTGGAGGLQGGYEIALDIQEGNLDRVFGRVQDQLMDMFGGRIATLEEAAVDPQAAAQLTKQVQMLTSGPLKIADTEQQAFKIIDAFAKGLPAPESFEDIIGDPGKALEKAVDRGNELQEMQLNVLTEMNNEIKARGVTAAFAAREFVDRAVGADTDFGVRAIERKRGISAELSGTRTISETSTTDLENEFSNIVYGIADMVSGGADLFSNVMSDFGIKPSSDGEESEKKEYEKIEFISGNVRVPRNPRDDVMRNANIADERARREERAGEGRRGERESTLVIQVRSDNEIRQMVKVYMNEYGEIIEQENIANAQGAAPIGR